MDNTQSKELALITAENCNRAVDQINEAYFDIPFENSAFQTEQFVIASQITPERAYRAIGLRLSSRLRALQEAKFGAMKEDVDIEELQAKIDDPDTNKFERRRAEIDIQQKISNRSFTQKLINDAVHECNVLYSHFQKLPKFTREEFEAGEKQHFILRLNRAVNGIQGAAESLINIETDAPGLLEYEETIQLMLEQSSNINDTDTSI